MASGPGTARERGQWLGLYLAIGALVAWLQPAAGAALWYPPIAIGMAYLLRYGWREWPWILICDTLVSLMQYDDGVGTALLIGANTTLEAALGAVLVGWLPARGRLESTGGLIAFLVACGGVATGVGATVGSVLLAWYRGQGLAEGIADWQRWWVGDATSVVCLLPLIVLWHTRPIAWSCARKRELALTLLAAALLAGWNGLRIAQGAAAGIGSADLLCLLPLLWAATRQPLPLVALTIAVNAVITVIMAWASLRLGTTIEGLATAPLIGYQTFMIAAGLLGLGFAMALESERVARVALESALAAREQVARRLNVTPGMLYAAAAEPPYAVTFVSANVASLLGYPAAAFTDGAAFHQSLIHPDDRARVRMELATHLPLGRLRNEFRARHRDGHYVWLMNDTARVTAADGSTELVGMLTDISERKQAESRLREQDALLAEGQQLAGLGIWRYQRHAEVAEWSPEMYRVFGVDPASFVSDMRSFLALVAEADRERVRNSMRACVRDRVPIDAEYDIVTPAGECKRIHSRAHFLADAGEGADVLIGIVHDISARLAAERSLRESERRLADTFAQAAIGMALIAPDGRFLRVNPALVNMLGYSADELLRENMNALVHADERDLAARHVARLFAGQSEEIQIEKRCRHRDGHYVWLQCTSTVVRGASGVPEYRIAQVQDISARKTAERELMAAMARATAGERVNVQLLARLNEAQQVAGVGSWSWDVLTHDVWWSDQLYHICGVQPGTHTPSLNANRQFVHPADLKTYWETFERALATRESIDVEFRIIGRDGVTRPCRQICHVECDDAGRPIRCYGLVQDLSAQKRAEAEIEAGRLLLSEAERVSRAGAWRWDLERNEWTFSAGCRLVLGCGEGRAAHLATYVHPDERAAMYDTMAGLMGSEPYECEHRLLGAEDGPTRWVLVRGEMREDADGRRVLYGGVTDISARKRLETRVQESQRIEAIGLLAGGIAHDFNNILSVILGNLALVRRQGAQAPGFSARLADIEQAGLRARELVEQILAFSRQRPQQLRALALGTVADEVLRLLRATMPPGIEIRTVLDEDTPTIAADASQIHQIVMNLSTNALRALEPRGSGHIDVEVHAVELDRASAQALQLTAGKYAVLVVRDDGIGMDAPTRARIFDPFFTTRDVGQGTGLGLSVVHGIVADHRGAIAVDSAPGRGSEFRVYFPAVPRAVAMAAPPVPAAAPAPATQPLRVLFVDDEPQLVAVGTELLELEGYSVRGFVDPAAAEAAFAQAPSTFDVLVTDCNMPGLSGLELVARLRAVRPNLPVVMMSGNLSDQIVREARNLGIEALIDKPKLISELAPAIARLCPLAA